ncbi:putative Ig domain-containing protein [Eubacterium maltosivorans]|uniref:Dockerin domain-containing protein n=1 Tax=Eubacterium maltosivorans TaxID=2041044 RepID=A0A4P9C7K0_EUBML|nr:YDG domain-containing protein [Eubacterium maltosivorans]QCT71440.1 hypothetical protein CPZ25_008885 [Eubacterium maltosivorans]
MEKQMDKRKHFLKTLTILFFSMLLLLPTLMLEGKEARAAGVTETRSADISKGNVSVKNGEVVRVYQTTPTAEYNVDVEENATATVILEKLNVVQSSEVGKTSSPVRIKKNAEATVLLKGKNILKCSHNGSSTFYLQDGAQCIIEDYGNNDGEVEVSAQIPEDQQMKNVILGASAQSHSALTINSGSVKAVSRDYAPAIGATAGNDKDGGSTLDLTINGGTVEAQTEGWGAAIGTQGDVPANQENTVNVTINGGKVIGGNYTRDVSPEPGKKRGGAVIGTGYGGYAKQKVTLNIPADSTADLNLTSAYGGAAIGGSGSWNSQTGTPNGNTSTSEYVEANIAGGNTKIVVAGQAPGIGVGAGAAADQKVKVDISGGNIETVNDASTNNGRGPGIGIGLFTQKAAFDCNISGGLISSLSMDDEKGIPVNTPAIGIAGKYKENTTITTENAKNNTFNLNVTGGTINAETRSTDTSIPDIGTIANNTFNVKVDGGSLNAVNQRMDVTAKNSQNQNVYPATVSIGGITEEKTKVQNAAIDSKDYGKDLTAQSGKLYLWTTPGQNKVFTATAENDPKAYTSQKINLAYNSGFTFAEPNVVLKKTTSPEELGSSSIKSIAENSVTMQVDGVTADAPVMLQAFEHGASTPVGQAQAYEAGKSEYTFSGLTKNKLYDIKALVNENDSYWRTQKEALVVKPFEYAPSLPNAKLKGAYQASVAIEGGSFTYALADGAVLPEGLSFSTNGALSGTPTQAGTFTFDVIATATDEGIAANNSRTASVSLKVEPVKVTVSAVDLAGQPLSCGCEVTSTAVNGNAAVGDTVLFTAIPCPLHDFVKFNLNANDVQATTGSGKFTYSYVVKAEDTELNMKAFMTESEKRITKIERVGDEKNLTLFANDEKNESAAQLKAFVNNQIVLKATYNDGEEKIGKASKLGLGWATNTVFSPKGGTYQYSVSASDSNVTQAVTVNTVTAELNTLNDVILPVNAEGYSTIAELGLPETIGCTYQAGVSVNSADRELAISWSTEIPENFGKTATVAPVVFEGSAAVPVWATIGSDAVSVNVNISDRVVLSPVISIEDKVYDGTKSANFKETPALDPEALTEGADVQLSGIPKAEFVSADAGKNIPVKVSGLSLTGSDAGKYILDFSQATGNITPAAITLSGISMEDKTVTEDGNTQTIEIKGTLPEGVSVSYSYLREGASEAVELPPSAAGTYTVTAAFKTDANHVVEPQTMSAKLVIEAKSEGLVLEEITTGLTEEQAAGMNAVVLKNGEAIQIGDTVAVGDTLTYQLSAADVRNAYVPYSFTMNGESIPLVKLAEGKGYSAEYTVKEGDTALKADAKCVLLGNFSGDDKINIIDAQQVAQASASGGAQEAVKQASGDVNFDGKVNIIDAQRIAQYAADVNMIF